MSVLNASSTKTSVVLAAVSVALAATRASAQYSTTWDINNLPEQSESQQSGTNKCGTTNSQSSQCQTMVVNSIDDFCLWGPPEPNSAIGATEQIEVAWCTKEGRGTRTIPQGTLTGVHFVQTPDYIQLTGVGDLTKMNINGAEGGGELDPHGPDGLGNPHGGLVFSNAFGQTQQIHEWTNFMSDKEFCIRVCKPGPLAWQYCNHVYDVMGCSWNMPGNYQDDTFETCDGDSDVPMGRYGKNDGHGNWGSTFSQGQPSTPDASPAAPSSQCQVVSDLGIGAAAPNPTGGVSTTSVSASTGTANSTIVATTTAVVNSTITSTARPSSTAVVARLTSTTAAVTGASTAGRGNQAAAAPSSSTTGGAVALNLPSGLAAGFTGLAGLAALAAFFF